MICNDCREGGNLYVAFDLSYDFIDEGDRDQIAECHAKCKGGTWCDCQCVVGPVTDGGKLCKRRST